MSSPGRTRLGRGGAGVVLALRDRARRGFAWLRAWRRLPADGYKGLDYFHATGLDAVYPMYPGNRVRVFHEGTSAFRSIERDLSSARSSIFFEVYIFASDECGKRVLDLLVDARRRGVRVYLLVDAVGSFETSDAFFEPLRAVGGRVERFNPIFGWRRRRRRSRMGQRDHRKILVIDGRVAFLGGMNVDDKTSGDHTCDPNAWRDTHARVTGPVVAAIGDLFFEHFEWETGERLEPDAASSDGDDGADEHEGDSQARVVGGEPGTRVGPIRRAYSYALRRSAKRAYLTTAYFVPPRSFLRSLKRAARRGVDVRIIVPGKTDYAFVQRAGQSFYAQLLRAGVRLFEWSRSPLHAKSAIVDDVWGVIGSANLDVRSFELNYEADLHVVGPRVGFLLTAIFLHDIEAATEIRLEEWEKRGLWRKLTEKFCALFRRLL